jgi:hypothetical protein
LIGALILILLMGGLTAYAFAKRDEAAKKTREANIARDEAKAASAEAETARGLAEEAKKRAKKRRKEALRLRDDAEKARDDAVTAQEKETKARKDLQDAAESAEFVAATERRTRIAVSEAIAGNTPKALEIFDEASKRYDDPRYRRFDPSPSGKTYTLANIAESHATLGGIPTSAMIDTFIKWADEDQPFDRPRLEEYLEFVESSIVESYLDSERDTEEKKKDLLRHRKEAINKYVETLEMAKASGQEENNKKTLIAKRLGDIYAISYSNDALKEEREKGFQEGIGYYVSASADYRGASAHVEAAKILRTAGEFIAQELVREKKAPGQNPSDRTKNLLRQLVTLWQGAGTDYRNAGVPLKEARLLAELGELHKSLAGSDEDLKETALVFLEQAASIYHERSKFDLEAPIDAKIADLAKDLKRVEEARSFHAKAFTAYGPSADANKLKHHVTQIALLSNDETEKVKADSVLSDLVSSVKEPATRAGLFEAISRAFERQPNPDRHRAITYLKKELNEWNAVGKLEEEVRTQFEIAFKYELKDQNERKDAIDSADKAIKLYKQLAAQDTTQPQQAAVSSAVTSSKLDQFVDQLSRAGRNLSELDRHDLAAEAYEEFFTLTLKSTPGASVRFSEVLKTLGALYLENNKLSAADALFKRALASRPGAATSNTIARLYAAALLRDKAVEYYEKSISAYEESYRKGTDSFVKSSALNQTLTVFEMIRSLYTSGKDVSRAQSYLAGYAQNARQEARPFKAAAAQEVLARLYAQSTRQGLALEQYEAARVFYQQENDKTAQIRVLKEMSKLSRQLGKKEDASEYEDRAEELLRPQ